MNVWLMNLKDNRDDKPVLEQSKFAFCREKEIVGIGWAECCADTEESTGFKKANNAINSFEPDDLIWTHDDESGEYYICKIKEKATDTPEANEEYKKYDIGQYCPCEYYEVGTKDKLPEGISYSDLISRTTISKASENVSDITGSFFQSLTKDSDLEKSENNIPGTYYGKMDTKKNKKPKSKKFLKIVAIILASLISITVILLLFFKIAIPEIKYHRAIKSYENGNYETAISQMQLVINYKNSSTKIDEIRNSYAKSLYDNNEYEKAIEMAVAVNGNPDNELINNCTKAFVCANIDSTKTIYDFLYKYQTVIKLDLNDIWYLCGCQFFNNNNFNDARGAFKQCTSNDGKEMYKESLYNLAITEANKGELDSAISFFNDMSFGDTKYKDSYNLSIAIQKKILIGVWSASMPDLPNINAILIIADDGDNCVKIISYAEDTKTNSHGKNAEVFLGGIFPDGMTLMNQKSLTCQSADYNISGSGSHYSLKFESGYFKDLTFKNTDKFDRSYHIDINYRSISDDIIESMRNKVFTEFAG